MDEFLCGVKTQEQETCQGRKGKVYHLDNLRKNIFEKINHQILSLKII
jgi:hypothetical protein